MTIDRSAPVISHRHLLINAPVEAVWGAHVDVLRWPEWQLDISKVSSEGPLRMGAVFTWETKGIDSPIESTVSHFEELHITRWSGEVSGIVGIHEWRFEDHGDSTLVTTEESFSGAPVEQAVAQMQSAVDDSLDRWLQYLAARVS